MRFYLPTSPSIGIVSGTQWALSHQRLLRKRLTDSSCSGVITGRKLLPDFLHLHPAQVITLCMTSSNKSLLRSLIYKGIKTILISQCGLKVKMD